MSAFEQKNHRQVWIAATVVLAIAAVAWATSGHSPSSTEIVLVHEGPVTLTVPGRARLVPRETVSVTAAEGGVITRLHRRAGERVVKGEEIAVLQSPQLVADLARLRRERDTAQAEYETRVAQIESDDGKARLEESRAQHAERVAEIQFRAEKSLHARGVSGAIAVEKAQAEYDQKVAEREFAQRQLVERQTIGAADRRAALRKREIAEAAAMDAQAKVDALVVRAPMTGVLGTMKVKQGASLATGGELNEVHSPELAIEIDVAEAAVVDVEVGQSVRIKTRSFDLMAKIASLEAVAENGLVIVRATSEQPIPANVRANTTAEANIITGELLRALTVTRPPGAMPRTAGSLYLVDDANDVAIRTRVEFGPLAGARIVIASGAKAGDRVAMIDSLLPSEPL